MQFEEVFEEPEPPVPKVPVPPLKVGVKVTDAPAVIKPSFEVPEASVNCRAAEGTAYTVIVISLEYPSRGES